MPRLSLFTPCERVLQGQDLSTSIIGVMRGSTITAAIAPLTADPNIRLTAPDVIPAPIRWSVIAIWEREEGDAGNVFHGIVKVLHPDGKTPLTQHRIEFKMDKEIHNTILNIERFPISNAGKYIIQLLLQRPDGEQSVVGDAYVYVQHVVAGSEQAATRTATE